MRTRKKLLGIVAAFAVVIAGGTYLAIGQASAASGPALLPITVTNDTGRSDPVYLYLLGTDLGTGRLGYVNSGGTFVNWPAGANPPSPAPDVALSGPGNGGRTTIQLPKNISGRLYFSLGEKLKFFLTPDGLVQPAPWAGGDANRDILFDWSEFTYNDAGIWLNSSQVDMFAIPHTVSSSGSEGNHSTGTLVANGRSHVIAGMQAAGLGGAVNTRSDGTVLRVLAPGKAADAGGVQGNYLDSYITTAWNAYASKTLTVVPFGDQPNVKYLGHTSGTTMKFTDAAGKEVASFNKPSSANVWGCDGALGAPNDQVVGPISRTLCAALNRGTLGTIDTQPSTNAADFYKTNPTNQYAKLVHESMADGKAYAFAFDDVGNFESLVHDGAPTSAGITLNSFGGGTQQPTEQPTQPGTQPPTQQPTQPGTQPGTQQPTQQPTQPATQPATLGSSLISNWNSKCIDVPAGKSSNGVRPRMWPCNNQAPQKFQFTTTHLEPQKGPLGAGQLKTSNNKCLAVAGGSKANGAAVQIATCSGNAAQQWLFSASAPGEIVNLPAKRCLDIKDWNGNNGAKLQLWDCAGTLNQLWHKG
ncbi:MAG: hypothetical protein QOC94_4126 [Actinoplanes sp.]|nr:hypothetical protein [Actinoplanes sp.]